MNHLDPYVLKIWPVGTGPRNPSVTKRFDDPLDAMIALDQRMSHNRQGYAYGCVVNGYKKLAECKQNHSVTILS